MNADDDKSGMPAPGETPLPDDMDMEAYLRNAPTLTRFLEDDGELPLPSGNHLNSDPDTSPMAGQDLGPPLTDPSVDMFLKEMSGQDGIEEGELGAEDLWEEAIEYALREDDAVDVTILDEDLEETADPQIEYAVGNDEQDVEAEEETGSDAVSDEEETEILSEILQNLTNSPDPSTSTTDDEIEDLETAETDDFVEESRAEEEGAKDEVLEEEEPLILDDLVLEDDGDEDAPDTAITDTAITDAEITDPDTLEPEIAAPPKPTMRLVAKPIKAMAKRAPSNAASRARLVGETDAAIEPAAEAEISATERLRMAVRDQQAGNLVSARGHYEELLKTHPNLSAAWLNLGVLLRQTGYLESAIIYLRRGVMLSPDDGHAWSNLGNALRSANRLDEASRAHRRAVELSPSSPQTHYNLALVARDLGDLDSAAKAFQTADDLNYQSPDLGWDTALNTLLSGDLEAGFPAYEARFKLAGNPEQHSGLPRWQGEDDPECRVLVHAEQGFGDTIQFARYLPQLAEKVGQVTFEVQEPLIRLLNESPHFDGITFIARDTPLPEVDFQIPLLSLPQYFPVDEISLRETNTYITSERALPDAPTTEEFALGVAWAGKPKHKNDRNRSIHLKNFDKILDFPGTRIHSFQLGDAAAQISELSLDVVLTDLTPHLSDFSDTAAWLNQMDLVITVDTSLAHLAGAMGRPVWLLLPFAPDWRWQLWRSDTPWYPEMTLFRQTSPGDWSDVFQRVRLALIKKLQERQQSDQ